MNRTDVRVVLYHREVQDASGGDAAERAARWALKCDKDRFAERVQTLYNTDAPEHVKKNARDALMGAGLIEKDESAAFADQVQQFFIDRRKE
jgi:hypothetical protein